jgi:uncharacterized protein YcfJ
MQAANPHFTRLSSNIRLHCEGWTLEDTMRQVAIAVASIFTVAAPAANAAYDKYGNWYDPAPREYRSVDYDRYHDTARVIDSTPVYEASGGREECWNPRNGRFEERQRSSGGGAKGAAIGALAGGVLGHQFGDSSGGRDRATGAGAIIGGLLGYQIDKNRNEEDNATDLDTSRCRVIAAGPQQLRGYDVRYRYNGNEYVARMDRNPGRRVVIGQDVQADGTPLYTPERPTYSWR